MVTDYDAPYVTLVEEELKTIVFNFCTLCSMFENKHMSFQLVMSLLLSNENYRNILKEMLQEEDDFVVFKTFITICPDVSSSKYVARMAKLYKETNTLNNNL